MSTPRRETTPRRQRRAPRACDFCRYRKMKCGNEKPHCQNCKEHGKGCVYVELAKKPRPSIARITQLEQENRQLQARLSSLRERVEIVDNSNSVTSIKPPFGLATSQLSDTAGRPCRNPSVHSEGRRIPTPASLSREATIARKSFSPDKESSYHGPTSVVFDEISTETEIYHDTACVTKVPHMWVKRQLVAESANQRQLETVNLLAEKLDFDVVDPDLGMHLLSIYWSRQQSLGPVVYRTVFMRDMACAGPYFSKLLLNAIYFFASKYTSRTEVRQDLNNRLTTGWSYRQRVADLLSKNFDNSTITTVQALLIMSSALFSWCDEKSTSWLYAGLAFNMIIDLGMQVDATTLKRRFSDEEFEIRLRVFWSAYVIDKLQSLYQGRPARLHEFITNLPTKFVDEHEELELFNALSYTESGNSFISPVYSISTFTESCKLSIILGRILLSLYTEKSTSRNPDELLRESRSLHEELENWRKSVPRHLDIKPSNPTFKNPLPHTLALLAMFNVLVILLHRPFVSDGHLHSASSSIALDTFSTCSAAAFEIDYILGTYERFFCLKTTPYIISYATYVSATIHVRLAAQRRCGSSAHKALRRCLDVLDIHQTRCWSPRRAKRVISGLAIRMGVVVDSRESLDETSDLVLSDLDVDAIIRTFAREQPPAETPIHHRPSSTGIVEASGSILQPSDKAANEKDLLNENTMPITGDDMAFVYDPIFGFNGSAFDDFDLGFGDGLM